MRRLLIGFMVGLCLGTAALAATSDPAVFAPIQKFIDSFNKGDGAGAAAAHSATPDLAILDELAPHLWRGSKAFQTWAATLDADSKKRGLSDQSVTLGTPLRQVSNGKTAYVVVPVVYTFKAKGLAMREAAQMTFVLKKHADGWLIHAWTWTGPDPEQVTGAKP